MMTAQSRQTTVLVALLVSIITGALILNALGYNPPSAGAFCLSRYYRLAPVEKSVVCETAQYRGRWRRIEIYCGGSSEEQAKGGVLAGVKPAESLNDALGGVQGNCHFVIWNGRAGRDGQIDATQHWKNQRSVNRQTHNDMQPALGDALTVFICLVTNRETDRPTDFQVKRAEALVEELCRRFNIWPESVRYPDARR
ncbi:MAG: N-acetylmuramoyl-L-alanine amidase [Phycisphaerales bacterium]|nr:MAG: N-acetylmuramoyl-L-alanine amidase [Phycisphaerales bacterium]